MNDQNSQKVIVTDACIGCGICATIAPDIFEMNSETNKSEVKSSADLANLGKAKEAADACPVGAIEVKED
jgi:ferredoxin